MPCEYCDDSGWKTITTDGVSRVTRCDCRREALVERRLREARIPPRYLRADFGNFITYRNERLLNAVEKAKRFADAFPACPKGLMFIAGAGAGKTHLAVSVLRQVVMATGARAVFCDTKELLREIKNTYNATTQAAEMDVLRPIMQAELLVFDDLGSERFTDWVEETMTLIVNARYNERRLTIFTSNCLDTPAEQGEPDSLIAKVGFRIHSRLREMCDFLEYDTPDFRDFPSNVGPEEIEQLWKGRSRRSLPARAGGQMRAQLRGPRAPKHGEQLDLKWPGGRAGS
ncbi:MAG: ATP-binding protein [Vicinamibacterales bacterium]